jgi:hypothetical protein
MQQQELTALIAARNKQLALQEKGMQQQYGLSQKQLGMSMYQSGLPGYTDYLGGEDYQYQIPGSNVSLHGQPAYQTAAQLAINKLQYTQPSYAGYQSNTGGGGTSGGGFQNDLASLMNLRTQASFSRNRQVLELINNRIQSMMR